MKRWIPIFVVLALLLTMPGFAFAADESSDAKKLSLSGHAEGFGDADLWISGTALDAVANITEDDMLLLRVDGVVRGEPVNAVLGIKEDGVYLAFPDAMEEKYFVSMDTLTDVFGDKAGDYGVHITAGKVDVGEVLSDLEMEKLTESLGKYFGIIAGFVKEENTVNNTQTNPVNQNNTESDTKTENNIQNNDTNTSKEEQNETVNKVRQRITHST